MKKVCIFLFSGTGLTRYVVRKLSAELVTQQADVDVFEIDSINRTKKTDTLVQDYIVDDYNAIGIA